MIHSHMAYFTFAAYLLVAGVNFFAPIGPRVGGIVLLAAGLFARTATRRWPILPGAASDRGFSSWGWPARRAVLLGLGLLGGLVVSRPCYGIDANQYHLPIAILMNASRWYPGIGTLNNAFGILHGNSILAAPLTAWGWPGIENSVNYIIWIGLGAFVIRIASRPESPRWVAVSVAGLVLFQYNTVSAGFNMGNDLAQGYFLLLGLYALYRGRTEDALLLCALSSVFRITGQVAFGLVFLWVAVRDARRLITPKGIMACAVVLLALLRTYIGTGLPLYPVPLPLLPVPDWGVPIESITRMGSSMVAVQPKVEMSAAGILEFLVRFMVYPKSVRSPWWFSQVLLVALLGLCLSWRRTGARLRALAPDARAALGVAGLVLLFWLFTKPQYRYAAGAWLFITLGVLAWAWDGGGRPFRKTLAILLCANALVFLAWEATRYAGVWPAQWRAGSRNHAGQMAVNQAMANRPDAEEVTVLEYRGHKYTRVGGHLIGRLAPPVLSARTEGDPEIVLDRYFRMQGGLQDGVSR